VAITEKREEQDYVKKKGNEKPRLSRHQESSSASRSQGGLKSTTGLEANSMQASITTTTIQPPVTAILLTLLTRAEFKYTLRGPSSIIFRLFLTSTLETKHFIKSFPEHNPANICFKNNKHASSPPRVSLSSRKLHKIHCCIMTTPIVRP
jgi:hypothetical protein